ncbi:hypothetical protein BB561_004714 [Smittium simulii]|uniref:TLC domain-containing protein n=1 Tax=Smittium simulii TaxID=133385 RepID=A0A2T9YER0_9FUNG|nr:hypothetical protein BB561_004714 [Smittium simulii]
MQAQDKVEQALPLLPSKDSVEDTTSVQSQENAASDATLLKEKAQAPSTVGPPKRKLVKRVMNSEEFAKINETDILGATSGFIAATFAAYYMDMKITDSMVTINYPVPDRPNYYYAGELDFWVALQFVLLFLFLRAASAKFVFRPISDLCAVKSLRTRARINEQGWQFLYGLSSFLVGIYLIDINPDKFGYKNFWTTYPQVELHISIKIYYLAQAGAWAAQMVTLFMEAKRSDFFIMLVHHIVTEALIIVSYVTNFTSIGIAIHTNMDAVDIFLPLAKLFKYIKFEIAVFPTFALMLCTWIYTRHYILVRIIYNILFEAKNYITFDWNPEQGYYASKNIIYSSSAFLISLEIMCIVWLYQIIKVIRNILIGHGTIDVRSDDEDDSADKLKKD